MATLELTPARLPGFVVLLVAMLAELLLAPLLGAAPGGLPMVRLMTVIVLLAALIVVGMRRAAIILFILALVAHLGTRYSSTPFFLAASATCRLLFLSYVVVFVIRRVLRDRTVTLNTVAGAACAYMLLAMVWASLYLLFEQWQPGSFDVPVAWTIGPERDLQAALTYFSFGTLTTLAYGVIHPTNPAAGSLCVAEALVGQLYLAIMIGRTVGLHISQRSE